MRLNIGFDEQERNELSKTDMFRAAFAWEIRRIRNHFSEAGGHVADHYATETDKLLHHEISELKIQAGQACDINTPHWERSGFSSEDDYQSWLRDFMDRL